MTALAEPLLASPCVGVCRLDEATGWCLGCARTGDELAAWQALDGPGRAAVWRDLPRRKAELRLGFELLPWTPEVALARLAALSREPGTVWSLGVPGAMAELPGPFAVDLAGNRLTLATAGGRLRLIGHPGLRAFAVADRIVLALHRSRLGPNPVHLTELGPDGDSLDPAAQGQPLFDLGFGRPTVRFGVRTAAMGLLRALRAGLGRPLDRSTGGLLAAVSPTRVLLGALGRVEIDGPIGAASGPRTVLHPALLAQGLELPPGLALPEGYAPLLSVTAAGRTRPWPHVA